MRVLINMTPDKAVIYSRPEAEFAALENGTGDAAVVVRGVNFPGDLARAASLGIPVVVVAGTEDAEGLECVELARSAGIPEAAVVVKRKEKVCSLDGKSIALAVRRGIGVSVVVLVAKHALENSLIPEPIIWEESNEPVILLDDQIPEEPSKHAGKPETCPVKRHAFVGSFPDLIREANRVIAVFRSVPEAQSNRIAQEIARRIGGQHVELSAEPRSYQSWANTLDEALAAGYLHSDGKNVKGEIRGESLVIEVDLSVFDPKILDLVYQKAEKVVQVVTKNLKEGEEAVKAWLNSGWKLDAVVSDSPVPAEALKKAFGKRAMNIKELF